jgi:hypothetical protein
VQGPCFAVSDVDVYNIDYYRPDAAEQWMNRPIEGHTKYGWELPFQHYYPTLSTQPIITTCADVAKYGFCEYANFAASGGPQLHSAYFPKASSVGMPGLEGGPTMEWPTPRTPPRPTGEVPDNFRTLCPSACGAC